MTNPILHMRTHSPRVSIKSEIQTQAGSPQSPLFTCSAVPPTLYHLVIFGITLCSTTFLCPLD